MHLGTASVLPFLSASATWNFCSTAEKEAEQAVHEATGVAEKAGKALEEGFAAMVQAPRHLAETVRRQVPILSMSFYTVCPCHCTQRHLGGPVRHFMHVFQLDDIYLCLSATRGTQCVSAITITIINNNNNNNNTTNNNNNNSKYIYTVHCHLAQTVRHQAHTLSPFWCHIAWWTVPSSWDYQTLSPNKYTFEYVIQYNAIKMRLLASGFLAV